MKKYILFISVFVLVFGLFNINSNLAKAQSLPEGCTANSAFSSTTGQPCGTTVNAGCPAGALFSSVTGQPCSTTDASGGSSSSSSGFSLTKNLSVGSRGDDVKKLQRYLKDGGYYPGTVDGSYGKGTTQSVKSFQTANGLPVTGNADLLTRTIMMNNGVTNVVPSTPNSEPTTIITPDASTSSTGVVKELPKQNIKTGDNNTNSSLPITTPAKLPNIKTEIPANTSPATTQLPLIVNNQSVGTSQAPVITISGITGPQKLDVNKKAQWTVKVTDNTTGKLFYSVAWGDEVATTQNQSSVTTTSRSATFVHSYSQPGTYMPTFFVTNNADGNTQASVTVVVEKLVANIPLYITTTSPLPNAKVGVLYKAYVYATEGLSSYLWSVQDSSLPSGLSLVASKDCGITNSGLSNVSNCILIFGTPDTAGPDTFYLQIDDNTTNSKVVTKKQFSLTVDKADVTSTPVVTVLSPNGGEVWKAGTIYEYIKWKDNATQKCLASVGCTYNITLQSSTSSYTIANNVSGYSFDYSYNWFVGHTLDGNVVPDGQYVVKICRADTTICDLSDSYFKITSEVVTIPSIAITTPSTLPRATKGVPYSATITASSNFSPFSDFDFSGLLPQGLTLTRNPSMCSAASGSNTVACQGTATLSGTLNSLTASSFSITAAYGSAKVSKNFFLGVDAAPTSSAVLSVTLNNFSSASQLLAVGNTGAFNLTKAVLNFTSDSNVTITELKFNVKGASTVNYISFGGVSAPLVSTPVVSGVAYLTGLNFVVPGGTSGLTQNAYASYGAVGFNSTASGSFSNIALTYVKYVDQNGISGTLSTDVTAPTMRLVGSKPTLGFFDSSASLMNGLVKIGSVTVSADLHGDIALNTLPLTVTSDGPVSVNGSKIIIKNTSTQSTFLTSDSGLKVNSGSSGNVTVTFDAGYYVPAGSSTTLDIYATAATVTGGPANNSLTTRLGLASLFIWTDVAGNGPTAAENGLLINNYPTNASVIDDGSSGPVSTVTPIVNPAPIPVPTPTPITTLPPVAPTPTPTQVPVVVPTTVPATTPIVNPAPTIPSTSSGSSAPSTSTLSSTSRVISSITPNSGPAGTAITVIGSNISTSSLTSVQFYNSLGQRYTFAGTSESGQTVSHLTIPGDLPVGVYSVRVGPKATDVSNAVTFTVMAAPAPISSVVTAQTSTSAVTLPSVASTSTSTQTTASVQVSTVIPTPATILPVARLPLSIDTSSPLSNAQAGVSYTTSINASGGSASYGWSISSGSLPNGLQLTPGLCVASPCQTPVNITGTPTTAGTYAFIVTLTSGSQSIIKQFSLTVDASVSTVVTCTTSKPVFDWVCQDGLWQPPANTPAPVVVPAIAPTSVPVPSPVSIPSPTFLPSTSQTVVQAPTPTPTTTPIPTPTPTPTQTSASTSEPAQAQTVVPVQTSLACTTSKPVFDWVCLNGGWLPPSSPLAVPAPASAITSAQTTTQAPVQISTTTPVSTTPTITMTAVPPSIMPGSSAMINWSSTNATSCNVNGNGGTSGSFSTGSIVFDRTYYGQCFGPNGASLSASVTVNIGSAASSAPVVTTPTSTTTPPTPACTTSKPVFDWVCQDGGWLPPSSPLLRQNHVQTTTSPATQTSSSTSSSAGVSKNITLFSDINYGGQSLSITSSIPDLSNVPSWNDQASSITVPTGTTVTLFNNTGYGGTSKTLSASQSDFRDFNMNDTVSSIRIESTSTAQTQPSAQTQAQTNSVSSQNSGSSSVSLADGCTVSFRASNGQYMVAENGGGGVVNANRNSAGAWEIFNVNNFSGGLVSFRTANGYYLGSSGGNLNAIASTYAPKFTIGDLNGGNVSLRTEQGSYVVAENGGGGVVNANRSSVGSWETWGISKGGCGGAFPAPTGSVPASDQAQSSEVDTSGGGQADGGLTQVQTQSSNTTTESVSSSLSSDVVAVSNNSSLNNVIIYEDANYGGASLRLSSSVKNLSSMAYPGGGSNYRGPSWNDRASSISVPIGLKVTLYEDSDFSKPRRVYRRDQNDFFADGINDKISSIKIEPDTFSVLVPLGLKASALDSLSPTKNPATHGSVSVNTQQPASSNSFKFTKFLEQDSYGNEVRELQKFLNNAGYDAGKVDGNFGAKVKIAVMKFQTDHGLKADGIMGYEMRTFLNK